MSKPNKYTEEQLRSAVATSFTIRGVLQALGLCPIGGGSYKALRRQLARYNVDTSHLVGKAHGTSSRTNKIPIADLLVEGSWYPSSKMRVRLIKEGILENRCANGHEPIWMGKKLTLQLDHINGENLDFRIGNLRLLCPNCHAQTDTYAGLNKARQNRLIG